MKKVRIILTMVMVTSMVAVLLEGCKKDESPSTLKVVSVKTNDGTALDGSTSATSVATNSSVVVTFDKTINSATATNSNIGLMVGGVLVPSTVSTSGTDVTIAPTTALANGTNYTVSITSAVKASDGAPATPVEYTFKTFGRANVAPPQSANQLSYFSFSGNMNDEAGTHTPAPADIKNLTFVNDRFGFAGLAGSFNGTTTIVEIPNGEQYLANNSFTLSFWIKANSAKNEHFVLGLAGWYGFQFQIIGQAWTDLHKGVKLGAQYNLGLVNGVQTYNSEDTFWDGYPNTWQGSTFSKDVSASGGLAAIFQDKWAHVVLTYNAPVKVGAMYVNGEKVRSFDFNLWPSNDPKSGALGVAFQGNLTGGGNKLALGFIQGSANRIIPDGYADYSDPTAPHYQGLMDDVRIFKVALSASEVSTLYLAEKP